MTPSPASAACNAGRGRRGVLLLVVLSMLTLFLMLGAAYMATAGRARETARAHARLTFGGDDVRTPYGRLLDTVALAVIRGGVSVTATGSNAPTVAFESLLADKYGPNTLSGTLSGCAVSGPILSASLTTGSAVSPTDLNGRVLTVTQPGRACTSHRILRATATGHQTNSPATTFTVALDMPARIVPFALPSGASRVIVNGREFAGPASVAPPSNESWDAFDDHNRFLARVAPGGSMSTSSVSRLSYIGPPPAGFGPTYEYWATGTSDNVPEAADNDGDSVLDGIFLDFGLPDAVDAAGNTVQLRASVLVVDLDGRFNVNAHGSLAPVVYGTSHPGWPAGSTIVTSTSLASVPLGSGYGPAEIAANLGTGTAATTPATVTSGTPRMFDGVQLATTGTGTENPRLALLTGARAYELGVYVPQMQGQRFAESRYTTSLATPLLRPVEGRYGEQSPTGWISGTMSSDVLAAAVFSYARPGLPNVADDPGTTAARRADPSQPASVNYGVPSLWWSATSTFNAGMVSTAVPLPRGVFNSPPDLHGRMKTLTLAASGSESIAPQVVFVQPEWSSSTDPREIRDNPYELQLDTRVGFGGSLKDAATDGQNPGSLADNPFTPAELEPVLRPYDIDTNRCQPRLVALLGSAAEDSRLKVTTDSWDTTAITGTAANALASWLSLATSGALYGSNPLSGIIGGEVSRGERFDLNRPLAPFDSSAWATANYAVQRQAYFKDLYTLLVALEQRNLATISSVRAAELAQWAANVVEFRDADSRMTPFEYDKNPRDGWGVDGDAGTADGGGDRGVVWGAERPEILIRETLAWDYSGGNGNGGLAVVLHRPWRSVALSKSGTIAGEPCDSALDTLVNPADMTVSGTGGIPGNIVDLGKKAGPHVLPANPTANARYDDVDVDGYPIWRLRIVAGGATTYVRFDTSAAAVAGASPPTFAPQTLAAGADKPKLPVDATLTVLSGTTVKIADAMGDPVNVSLAVSGSTCAMGQTFRVPTGQTSATLYLERLSDPSRSPTAAQWTADPLADPDTSTDTLRYVVVDSCTVTNCFTGPPMVLGQPGSPATSARRAAANSASAFWKNLFVTGATITVGSNNTPFPTAFPAGQRDNVRWFPWLNRPFVSAAELVLVPRGDSRAMLADYQMITETTGTAVSIPVVSGTVGLTADLLFDAVHVPTRFAGIHATASGAALANAGIWAATTTANQLSSFREPGRVNLNTVTSRDVWNSVVGGPLPSIIQPFSMVSGSAQTLAGLLGLGPGGGVLTPDTTAPLTALNWQDNPQHRFYTATRLANTVTPRSHVFAVWITLREMVPNDPDSVQYHRGFYIVDRSIPVGYEAGRTHNVWDCVRLRRIIE